GTLGLGDFNGDGHRDVIALGSNNFGTFVQTFRGDGTGSFTAAGGFDSSSESPDAILVADVNHDGRSDLLTHGRLTNTLSVRLGDPVNGLGNPRSYGIGSVFGPLGGGIDLNQDGNPDVVTNTSEGKIAVLFGDGQGRFDTRVSFLVGNGSSFAVADFNR